MAELPFSCYCFRIGEAFGSAVWACHGLPWVHGLFLMATLAQEEKNDSQNKRQRGETDCVRVAAFYLSQGTTSLQRKNQL